MHGWVLFLRAVFSLAYCIACLLVWDWCNLFEFLHEIFQQVKALNDGGEFPSNAEVVIAPPSIFLQTVKDSIRSDIKVSANV